MNQDQNDRRFMLRALKLAARGAGTVHPNPLVGAVIVKDGETVGEGNAVIHEDHAGDNLHLVLSDLVLKAHQGPLQDLFPEGRIDEAGVFELEKRVRISANSTHALIGHGVLDALNELELDGELGRGVPIMVRPSVVEQARSILYQADRKTYGGAWGVLVDRLEGDPPIEHRVAVANREYQVTLVRLIDVMNQASRVGDAVWIEI